MLTRTISHTVVFRHPFTLETLNEVRPAGAYVVDTEEELIESLSFVAYRRVSTWLRLPMAAPHSNQHEVARIDPAELEAALARDAVAPSPATEHVEAPCTATPISPSGIAALRSRMGRLARQLAAGWPLR